MKKTGQEHQTTRFNLIKEEYESFYNELMGRGKFPFGTTKAGYWGSSFLRDVFFVFKKINLNKYKNFIDLGSGDGSVVMVASLFTRAFGFELDKGLFNKSIEIKDKLIKQLNIKSEVTIRNEDYLSEDFSRYHAFYIYPDKPIYSVENKLLKEMKKNAILIHYGNNCFPLQLKKIEEFNLEGMKASVYRK